MLHGLVDDSDLFSHAKIASDGNFYLLLEKTSADFDPSVPRNYRLSWPPLKPPQKNLHFNNFF